MFTRDTSKLCQIYESLDQSTPSENLQLEPGHRWVRLVQADGREIRVGFGDKYYVGFDKMPGYENYRGKGVPVIAFPAKDGWSHGAPPKNSKLIEILDDGPIAQNTEQPVS